MTVDCSNDVQWAAYLQRNPAVVNFEHLRPAGVHELPSLERTGGPGSPKLPRRVVIVGPPGAGKTVFLQALGVPAEALLPPISPEADPASGPAGLAAYADLVAARDHPVLEGSVRDSYGVYARQLLARGFELTEEFKAKGIRAITAEQQTCADFLVLFMTPNFGHCCGLRRDIEGLFGTHYARERTTYHVGMPMTPGTALVCLNRNLGQGFGHLLDEPYPMPAWFTAGKLRPDEEKPAQ